MKHKIIKKILPFILVFSMVSSSGCGLLDTVKSKLQTNNANNNQTQEENIEGLEVVDNIGTTALKGIPDEDFPEDNDYDGDGLTNKQELEIGTNIQGSDTDFDGLSDYDEINVYHTDPLNPDTDNDTISDGMEIALSLNPLSDKSDGTTHDNEILFDKTYSYENISLDIKGNANAQDISIEKASGIGFDNNVGVVSPLYEIYNGQQSFYNANLTIEYDLDKLKKNKSKEENLKIYQLKEDGTFVEVGGEIDLENHKISVSLEHFSYYFVADSTLVNEKQSTEVFILLDNSGSMYPKELCKDNEENDVDFKRVEMSKQLISMTDDTITYALGKFTGTYKSLVTPFTNDKDALYEKLDAIKTEDETFNGTFIANSLINCMSAFDKSKPTRKFVIMLTDGETTEGKGLFGFSIYDEDDAIKQAIDKNISIIVIGLGNNVDTTYLSKIASETGGFYVYANDADALDRVYQTLIASLNYGFVDLDGDGTNDHILIADSGFDVSQNGWSFTNYSFTPDLGGEAIHGQCAGLAAVAQLYYRYGYIPTSGEEYEYEYGNIFKKGTLQSNGYDISNVPFFSEEAGNQHLHDLKLFGEWDDYYKKKSTETYHRDEENDKYMTLNDDARACADKYDIVKVDVNNTNKDKIYSEDNKPYNKYDSINYDLENVEYDKLSIEEQNAYNVLDMVNYYFGLQKKPEYFQYIDIASADYEKDIREKNFQEVVDKLNSGIPLILGGEGHAVNAIRLYKKVDNPNEYDLIVYDNNSPDEEKHITIQKFAPKGLAYLDLTARFNDYDYRFIDTDGVFGKEGKEVKLKFEEVLLPEENTESVEE